MILKIVDLINKVQEKLTDDSDMPFANFQNTKELRNKLNSIRLKLMIGDLSSLSELNILFSPTACLQEHAISNHWSDEYLYLAGEFDIL